MAERVAVVVPVLDEAGTIASLVTDLEAQDPPPAEIVVVDAGSTDGTVALLRSAAGTLPSLRIVEAHGATPGRGRNEGVRTTTAPIVVTLDAGSSVEPGFVAALAEPVVQDGRVATVGVSEPEADTAFERAAGWFTLSAFKPQERSGPIAGDHLPAGRNGIAFAREAWEAAGGYPPDLPWGEDKVFLQRLRAAGVQMEVVSAAIVRWRPRRSLREVYRQYRNYGRGDALARIDRQNELVTMAVYLAGAALAVLFALGSRTAGAFLVAGFVGYLALFVLSARRALGWDAALAWIPPLRLVVDVAKMHGFLEGVLLGGRLRR